MGVPDTHDYTASDDEVVEVTLTVEELEAALVLARRREYEALDIVLQLERELERVRIESHNAVQDLRDLADIALMHRDGLMSKEEALNTLLVMLE
jgi:hypothetical protein